MLDFQIESSWWGCSYDGVIVDGVTYCGSTGPDGVQVTTSSSISLYSDYSVAHGGAHICLTQTPPDPTFPDALAVDEL